jgi:hypothetical protein
MTERAARAKRTVEEQAEEARRQVLGARSRIPQPRVAPTVKDDQPLDAGELGDILRRLAGDVEEETSRLRDGVGDLRAQATRAQTALQEQLQRAAEAMAEQSAEEVDREVGPTVAEAVTELSEQLVRLEMVTTTMLGAVERLAGLAPAVERLEAIVPVVERLDEVADRPSGSAPTEELADALGELSQQLTAVGGAIRDQVQGAVEQALIADARRRDAAMTQALALLAEEFVRLRRHLSGPGRQPAQKQPAKKQAAKKQAAKKAPAKKAPAKKKR